MGLVFVQACPNKRGGPAIAGGGSCAHDEALDFTFTTIIWCNPAYNEKPQDIKYLRNDPELPSVDTEDEDPCNVFISM